MKSYQREIVAGTIGSTTFLLFFFLIQAFLPVSILAAIASYIGTLFLIPKHQDLSISFDGLNAKEFHTIMKHGKEQLDTIETYSKQIHHVDVRKKTDTIIDIGNKILDNLEKDPKDMKIAKKFFSYYLTVTEKIVRQYVELSQHKEASQQVSQTLRKIENVLDIIVISFNKQLEKMLADDMLDIDTEIDLLKRTVTMEGLQ